MNQVKNKTEDDIRETVGKFNDSTWLKIRRIINRRN